jgi:hypothetical protein
MTGSCSLWMDDIDMKQLKNAKRPRSMKARTAPNGGPFFLPWTKTVDIVNPLCVRARACQFFWKGGNTMKTTGPVCHVCGETHLELFHYNGRKDSRGNKIPRAMCRRCDWRSRWKAAIRKGDRVNIARKLKTYMLACEHREKFYKALAMKESAGIKRRGGSRARA